MSRPVPQNQKLSNAVNILRDRHTRHRMNYTDEQIQEAVEMVRKWDPDYPLLRYSERKNLVSKPSK